MITHNGKQYKVFDTHTHAFPDAIAREAVDALKHRANLTPYHDGSYSGLCAYELRADRFLLLPIATKPHQAHSVNTWAARHAGGKLLAFGSVHPDSDQLMDELDEVARLGLLGIKLHPEYQQFYVDDERALLLYEAIFARGLRLVFHAGVDLGYGPPIHCTPERLARVLDAFPSERIIAAHMGGYRMEAEASQVLSGRRNLWMDLAFVAGVMPHQEFAPLVRAHGADRVLFATDAPWTVFDDALQSVLDAGFTDAELRAILYDNAASLLGVE